MRKRNYYYKKTQLNKRYSLASKKIRMNFNCRGEALYLLNHNLIEYNSNLQSKFM